MLKEPVRIFLLYAPEDRAFADELKIHLRPLTRQGIIALWDFTQVPPGAEVAEEVERELRAAHLIVVLISAKLLASDAASQLLSLAVDETKTRITRLVPVLLTPGAWQASPIGHLQILPRDGRPRNSRDNGDEFWAEVVTELREILGNPPALRPAPETGAWQVPLPRNLHFIGRDELLEQLGAELRQHKQATLTPASIARGHKAHALTGLGGIGKTQVALEYVYRHHQDYQVVWWLDAEDEPKLLASYDRIARLLGLIRDEVPDPHLAVRSAHAWLARRRPWLIVYDNAEDRALVQKYIPLADDGHVLVTSRNPNWGGVAARLQVSLLPREQAVALLLERSGQRDSAAAGAVAAKLGDLPMALTQAAAYVEATGCNLEHYLKIFDPESARLLKVTKPDDYPQTVAATWSLSIGRVERSLPVAKELLSFISFLDSSGIPLRLLREQAQHLPPALAATAADPLRLDEAIGELRRHALLDRENERLLVHRLVQLVARDALAEDVARQMAARAVAAVNAAFQFRWLDLATWAPAGEMLPHALAVTTHADRLGLVALDAAHLRHRAGRYLHCQGLLQRARQVLERSLAIKQQVLKNERNPHIASSLHVLGAILYEQGELAEAQRHLERSLEIKRELGELDIHIASSLHVLACVLQKRGELQNAQHILERALQLKKQLRNTEEHPDVVHSLRALAGVLLDQGELQAARAHLERCLTLWRSMHGTDTHPADVAASLHDLARVLQEEGDLIGARHHLEQALAIKENVYGTREHYLTAGSEEALGHLLRKMGEEAAGMEALSHALAVYRKQLGPGHRDTRNLAAVLGET